MFLMLIPQLAFKLPFCNQINLLCAAVEAFAINYMTTEVFLLGWIFNVSWLSRMKITEKSLFIVK